MESPTNGVSEEICPTDNDVLRGRGNGPQQHPGNQQFRIIIERYRETYVGLKKTCEKQAIADKVCKEIESLSPPGRFLKQSKGDKSWSLEEDSKVKSKIKQALREKRQTILERQGSGLTIQTPPPLESDETPLDFPYEKYTTLDIDYEEDVSSTGSLEMSSESFRKLYPLPPLHDVTQGEGLLDNAHLFSETTRPPHPPTNEITPIQNNTKSVSYPNAEEVSTPVMKRRFLPREVSLGRGPGPGGLGQSTSSMRNLSLGLIDSSMGSMVITDESFQRLSEGDIGIDVDPIPVTNEDIIKNSRGYQIEYGIEANDVGHKIPTSEASNQTAKEKYLPRERMLGRGMESSNTGASARFIDTSVGMIDVSMKSLDLTDTAFMVTGVSSDSTP